MIYQKYIGGDSMEKEKNRTFKHLTYTDRLRIEKWLKAGLKPLQIAKQLRITHQTIYNELKRGRYERLNSATWELETSYSPDIAEEKYRKHLKEKGGDLKIGKDKALADFIETTIIEKNYSPAAALAEAREAGFDTDLSKTTIYSYIKKGVFLNLTQKELPRRGKHKQKYKKVDRKPKRAPAGESIEQRPKEVESREEFGHWEGDTMYSRRNASKAGLITITERKTRKDIIIKIPNRKAETVVTAIDALEKKWGADNFCKVFKTITLDNGVEFSSADLIERSCFIPEEKRTKVYFAHPYSSFERGTNENQNGMIRRRHPKGTDFEKVSEMELQKTEEWINNYPRGILGYSTSNKMFAIELQKLGINA